MQTPFRRIVQSLIVGCSFAFCCPAFALNIGDIVTVAGGGGGGDGGAATAASLNNPYGVAVDSSGNLYIADFNNHRIRKVTAATGIITTVAGNGTPAFAGDGAAATAASLNNPVSVTVDSSGNLYIADRTNNRIRKVTAATGIITTVAGNGTTAFAGDGGAATAASIYYPFAVTVDSSGNLYIADSNHHRIRKVTAATGIITTVAGNGFNSFSGDGLAATSATLSSPTGVTLDSTGNLYIADWGSHRIRKVTVATGIITTVAGNGAAAFSGDGAAATAASFGNPYGVTVDSSNNLYITDTYNHRIRKVTAATGIITTVAGNGFAFFSGDGVAATAASISWPGGVVLDSRNNLYIGDTSNNRIRKVYLNEVPTVSTLVSSVPSNTTTFGNTVTFTASLSSSDGVPDGSVTFMDGAAILGTVALDSNGKAVFTTSALAGGSHSITAVYAATGIYAAASSAPTMHFVVAMTPSASRFDNQSSGSITFSANPGATFQCSLDGADFSSCTSPFTYSNLANGQHVLVVKADDGAGNTSAPIPFAWTVDTSRNINSPLPTANAVGQIITIAGGGVGDITTATTVSLNAPYGVTIDSSSNLYIADTINHRIRKVAAATGIITTVAGNGTATFAGDGGSATAASIYFPSGVTVDSSGNLYIADQGNHRIRKVTAATGIITTVAGNGAATFSGDGATATSASFYNPIGVTVDSSGNLYIADTSNNRIRKVTAATGIITTVVGNGTATFAGDNGAATSASLYGPTGVSVDSSGNLYIADISNNRIRKVTAATGIITTVAGNGTIGFSGDGATATAARLRNPGGVTVDNSGNLYICDSNNHRIRKVTAGSGIIATVAGNGTQTFAGDNGSATSASLYNPYGVTVDSSGNFYIADRDNHRVRKVSAATGVITTVAGNGAGTFSGDGGAATAASLYNPAGVSVDNSGNLYIADQYNHRIRKVTVATGIITTVAGNGTATFAGDNGAATSASLNNPYGVTHDSSGNLYISDYNNQRIRKVTLATGIITTVAGNGTIGFAGDGAAATAASLSFPAGIAVDSSDNLYIVDNNSRHIRKVTAATGIITTVAGNGAATFTGDGGAATAASFYTPYGVTVDSSGNLYIADTYNNRVRRVDATTGIITTVAGNGTATFAGDGSSATAASLYYPYGVSVDSNGNLYIADTNNSRIRKVYLNPVPTATVVTSSSAGNTSASSSSVTFTATVSSNEGIPTNTSVTFMDGAITLGTGVIDATGTATFATSALAIGSHSITVIYPATGVLATSTSSPLVQTVVDIPTATTGAASAITTTTATLNGTVNDNGSSATVSFEYGLTTGYGTTASAGTVTSGSGSTSVSAALIGLACGTTYHFRVVGQNSAGTTNGSDVTFTTIACPLGPPILNYPAKAGNTFTVFRVDPTGAATSIYSGTQTSYTDSALLKPNTIYSYYVTSDLDPSQTTLVTIRTPLYNGWNIVGVPYNTTGIAASTLFGSPVSAVYEWIPTGSSNPDNNGHYIAAANLAPGKGYFVKTRNGSTMLAYSGAANPASVNVTLKPGYTLITNTLTSNMNSIDTNWQIDGFPLGDAIISSAAFPIPVIGGAVYWWNGINYDSWNILDVIPANRPAIEPWKAYWILNLDTVDHTLTIQ